MAKSDQSHLYTGVTSSQPAKSKSKIAAEARQKRIEAKQEARHKVRNQTDVPLLAVEFKKEIDKLLFAPYEDEEKMTDRQFAIERRARRVAIKSLIAIQTRVTNILREQPDPKKIAAEKKAEAEAAGEMDLSTDDFE
jgi:hypothetical protein